MRNKILMTLALLITAVGGAWADGIQVKEITSDLTGTWQNDNVNIKATELPGFVPVSLDEAKAMAGSLPTSGYVYLFYAFDGGKTCYAVFQNGNYQRNGAANQTHGQVIMTVASAAKVYYTYYPDAVAVSTNAAEGETTFTEAEFFMPTNDVDVDYELVRDMSINMTTTIGDGNDGYRIRMKKNEQTGKYEPAEMTVQEMIALVKVHDAIENYDLTFGVLGANCIVNIYAANENNEATGNPIAFQDLTPGRYIAKAVAATGSAYEGETAMSNIFVLFEGYQIVIPAGEYATYYKDEALKVEDQEVELLTITAVENGKAVLSDASDAMPKNTPFLVHNNGTEEKTILLIPCNDPDLAVTVADEFLGTLTEKTFTDADMGAGADFYVCNGKEFIQVRGAGTLAANKAYLKVTGNNTPASIPFRRSIDGNGEGTTGIDNLNVNDNLNDNEATWYDLGGRRLQGKPAQKGIYIKNGKKVVVH